MSFENNSSTIKDWIHTHFKFFIAFFCLLFFSIIALVTVRNTLNTIKGPNFEQSLLESGKKEITFCFDQDIIAFSSYEESAQEWLDIMDLSFTPEVTGSIRTISGNKFTYTFDTPISPDQEISVFYNTNITSLRGARVSLRINYQESPSSPFIIKRKEFQVSYASKELKDLYSPIYMSINRAITLKELKKGLSISNQQQQIKFGLKYTVHTNQQNSSTSCIITNYNEVHIFPHGLKKHSTYELNFDYSKIDTASELEPFTYEIKTYEAPQWLGLNDRAYPNQTPRPVVITISQDFWLIHSTPIKDTSAKDSLLTLSPEVSNLAYDITGSSIQISGDFKGNTEYSVSFTPKKLVDIYGQKITDTFTTNFQTQHQEPSISQVENVLYIDREKPVVPFQTVNVSNITITYQLIGSAYYAALTLYGRNVPVVTYKTNFTIDSPVDQVTWQEFDLTKLLANKNFLILMNIQDRDNPTANTNFTRVIASTSGLMAHISMSDIILQAHDIKTQTPYENMMISIWDPVRGSFQDLGRTKSDGFLRLPNAKLPLRALEKPVFIGIYEDRDEFEKIAFLSGGDSYFNGVNSGSYFSSSPRLFYNNITTAQQIQSMVFTDRPSYKLGEEVQLHAVARTKTNNNYTSSDEFFTKSANIIITDPNNKTLTNTYKSWSSNGSLGLTLEGKQTLISGQYSVQIKNTSEDFYAHTFFNVYPLTPKTTEIVFSSPKQKFVFSENLLFSLRPQFLFGEALPSTVSYTVTASPLMFTSKKYPYYHFGTNDIITPYNSPNTRRMNFFPQPLKLLLKGTQVSSLEKAKITIDKKISAYHGKNYQLHIYAKAASDSTVPIEINNENISIFQPVQLGIKTTKTIITNNETMEFKIIAIDPITEEIISKTRSVLTINKTEKLTLGKLSFITNFLPINQHYTKTVFTKTMKVGEYDIAYTPSKEGDYQAIVHTYYNNVKISSSTYFSVLGKESISYDTSLSMELDNTLYQSGDTASLHITNPFEKARLLLFIERDTLRESHSIILTNNIYTHPIALTYQDIPGVNITAILSSISNTENTPLTLYGETSLKVNTHEKTLSFQINTSKPNYLPKEMVEINLIAYNAQNKQIDGEAVVIIRDKAVLEQGVNDIPNPIDVFYDKRASSFSTWHSGKQLLESKNLTNKVTDIPMPINPLLRRGMPLAMSTGLMNDGTLENSSQVRSNFPYTIYYNNSVKLSRNKKTTLSFQLPDNISGFDITVIAYDKHELFGKTNHSFTSFKKLMIDPILPSFVRPDDLVTWGAYIRNFSDNNIDAKVTLNNVDSLFTKNISIPKKSYIIVTNSSPIKSVENPWNILVKSTNLSDNLVKNIPIVLDNPWMYSSYSGYINNSTNFTLETDIDNNLEQTITLQLSSTPTLQVKETLKQILTTESLYIERILQRLLLFIGNEDLFISNQLVDLNKKELITLLQNDLNSLVSYYINTTSVATSPLGTINISNPITLLQIYESLLLANQHSYQIDSNLFKNMTDSTLKISKNNRNNSANSNLAQAYALRLLASNKLLDRENFKNIYPRLASNASTQALILDTMHLLNFPLQDISKQTLSLMSKTTETGSTILINNSDSRFIASTLIKYYGNSQDGIKILNGLDMQKQDNIFAFVSFLQKYPPNNNYKINVNINNYKYVLSETNNTITLPIKKQQLSIAMDTTQQDVYYNLVYAYIPKESPTQNDSGYQINKNIYHKDDTNTIISNNLVFGESYIVELEITPKAKGNQQIEIIDPLYGGVVLDSPIKQKEYLKNATYVAKQDKLHIFTKLNGRKITVRYLVIAKTFGTWTAPPSSVQFITSPDVFGFQAQKDIIIK